MSGEGKYTVGAKTAAHAQREWDLLTLKLATAYALGHGLGARAAIKTGLFPGLSKNSLHTAIHGGNKRVNEERLEHEILTEKEQSDLVGWITSSARGKDPATSAEISDQVVMMLKARKLDNKRRRHGHGCVKLTPAEARLVTESNAEVSHVWLTNFAAKHPTVRPKKVRSADATRTKKQNEGVVHKHFHGEFGVVASLESVGNLDLETKMVRDPRSVWWFDEMPQAVDASAQGPRKHAWGVVGEALEASGSVNRETDSVGMLFNLAGFLMGPQFNVGRENFTCGLADCLEAPTWAKSFDNQIYTLDAKSTYCTMAKTANGVQTKESFFAMLKAFRMQVDAYSAAEVAAGRPALPWIQWMGTDNHASRFGADVLEACSDDADKLGIRLFMEESKTSQFLQPPDQVTKLCHGAYIRGKKQYQKLHKAKYGEEATIGFCEFIEIWGGCRDLGYEGAWFSWANAQVLVSAWRRCGWLGCLVAPDEIDRSIFVDQPTAEQPHLLLQSPPPRTPLAPSTVEQAMAVPDGVRTGSLAAAQAQVEQLQAYIAANTHAPFDPVAAGLLTPRTSQPTKRTRDKTRIEESEGGDSFLRDLAASARAKQLRKEEHVAGVTARKEARVEARTEKQSEKELLLCNFMRCRPTCQCGVVPCPMEGMHHCSVCGDIKRNVCRKQACVAKRAPLALEPPQQLLDAPDQLVIAMAVPM